MSSTTNHPSESEEIIREILYSLHLTHFVCFFLSLYFDIISGALRRENVIALFKLLSYSWDSVSQFPRFARRRRRNGTELDFANFIILFSPTLHYDNALVFSVTTAGRPAAARKTFVLFLRPVPFHGGPDVGGGAEKRKFEFFIPHFFPVHSFGACRSVLAFTVSGMEMYANCVFDVLWMNLVQGNFHVNWAPWLYYYYRVHSLLWVVK